MDADRSTPLASGNTRASAKEEGYKKEGKLFLFTVNPIQLPHYDEIMEYIRHWNSLRYYLVVEHFGQKQQHYHILAQYRNSVVFNCKQCFNIHLKKCTASIQKGIAYCMCTDEKHINNGVTAAKIAEWGEPAFRGGITRGTLKKMDRDEVPAHLIRIHKEVLDEEKAEEEWEQVIQDVWDDKIVKPKVIYVHGEPGNGKTYGAIKWCKDKYDIHDIGRVSIQNGFFSFIKPQAPVHIICEFKDDEIEPGPMLDYLDQYGSITNVKHGQIWTKPKVIIICSSKSPKLLWADKRMQVKAKEIVRRIDEFYVVDENHNWMQGKL